MYGIRVSLDGGAREQERKIFNQIAFLNLADNTINFYEKISPKFGLCRHAYERTFFFFSFYIRVNGEDDAAKHSFFVSF